MTLQQLHYFRTLSKVCHFTKAAEQLFISQSSLSYAISELEKELNVQLFERRGNRIYLSKYGQEYSERIDPILDSIDDANRYIKEMITPDKGNVKIGVIPSLFRDFSYMTVKKFYDYYPCSAIDIKIHSEITGRQILSALESGVTDLTICSVIKDNMEYCELFPQKMFLYVPMDHRLANRESVDVDEIQDEDYIALTKANSARAQIDSICQKNGLKCNIVNEQETFTAIMSFVSNGLGVAILPYSSENEMYGAKAIKINQSDFNRTIYLTWMKDKKLTAAVEMVKQFLIDNSLSIYSGFPCVDTMLLGANKTA